MTKKNHDLQWNEEAKRWYLDGHPIHAGSMISIQGSKPHPDKLAAELGAMVPGDWMEARLESRESGRELDAYIYVCGVSFKKHVAGFKPRSGSWGDDGIGYPEPWTISNAMKWATRQD